MSKFAFRWHAFAVWLAIAGVVYRGLIPVGFMPADARMARGGSPLVLCSAGIYSSPHAGMPGLPGDRAGEQCAFAASAAPVLPITSVAIALLRTFETLAPTSLPGNFSAQATRSRPPVRGPPPIS